MNMRLVYSTLLMVMLASIVSCKSTPQRIGYYKVRVRAGDSLASIAHKFDTTPQQIMTDNDLKPYTPLSVGMVLRVRPGPAGYVAGTKKLTRGKTPPKTTRNQQSQPRRKTHWSFWDFLFGDTDETSDQREGLLYGRRAYAKPLLWPVRGAITSGFGMRWGRMHEGIDIKANLGTNVQVAASGRVVYAGRRSGYGRLIIIDHGSYETRYAHLSQIDVGRGQHVSSGAVIGEVGRSGNATGSHLHFEYRDRRGVADNPLRYLPRRQLLSSL